MVIVSDPVLVHQVLSREGPLGYPLDKAVSGYFCVDMVRHLAMCARELPVPCCLIVSWLCSLLFDFQAYVFSGATEMCFCLGRYRQMLDKIL